MKILSVGDIHGRTEWKGMGDISTLIFGDGHFIPEYDYYVFVGDYTDSFVKTSPEIFSNLTEIVNFKKLYPKNVILLLGNHDLQYWFSYNTHGCSGYRGHSYFDLNEFFRLNMDLFQVAFSVESNGQKYLWTHAGVHKGWYSYEFPFNSPDVANDLNLAFNQNEKSIYDVGLRRGGSKRVGGPFWADRNETWQKPLPDFHQIVGHTRCDRIMSNKLNDTTSITYIDCIENGNFEPYIIKI